MADRKKLKIAFVFDDSLDRNDGVQQYVKTLGSWFNKQGHNVVYFVGETKIKNWDGGKIYSLANNLKVKFNANYLTIPLPARLSIVKQVINQENPDILHVQVPYSPFMAQKVINNVSAKSAIVGTFHILPAGGLHRFGSKLLSIYYGKKINKFDRFFAVSPPAQTFAINTFKISSEVLPNVVDISKFKTDTVPRVGRIVFLGRLVDRKGAEHLIKACGLLSGKINFELTIAGDGPDRNKLEKLTNDLGIKDQVKFKGFVSEEEKVKLLASAHIACFPSLYGESFGIVLIEAMAAGSKVVLGGNNPGYASVLEPRPQQLIDPLNHNAFANKLEQFLANKIQADEACKWQARYVKQFDVDVVGKKLESIYYNLLENKTLR